MNTPDDLIIDLFGDLSLNGLLCDPQHIVTLKSNLKQLSSRLSTCDLRVVNWESPISTTYDFHKSKGTILATTIEAAAAVTDEFHIDIASLGNNHVGDCRDEGFDTTTSFLHSKNIKLVGATKDHAPPSLTVTRKGRIIGFLSYVGEEANTNIENDVNIHINTLNIDQIISHIQTLKKEADIVIVSLHWGSEFISYPSEEQKKNARRLIDAGANVIYGHHTHCLQGMEKWNDGLIFYSLGNFIFSGLKGKETVGWPKVSMKGGYYQLCISGNTQLDAKFVPFKTTGSNITLDNTKNTLQHQAALSRIFNKNIIYYRFRRKVNVTYISLIILPLFFYKSKGGFLSFIRGLKKEHFKLVFSYFTSRN